MRMATLVSVVCILVTSGWASGQAKTGGTTPYRLENLQDLAKQLAESGEAWLEDKGNEKEVQELLATVNYDEESVAAIAKMMTGTAITKKDPINLYVIDGLLQPIVRMKPESIRKAVPLLRPVTKFTYLDMPKFTPEQLKQYKYPDKWPDDITPDARLNKIDAIDKMRDAKLSKERPLAWHNAEVGRIERLVLRLSLLADDSAEDVALMNALTAKESAGLYMYGDIADMICADKFDAARTRKFYDFFIKTGTQLLWVKKEYARPYKVALKAGDNSTLGTSTGSWTGESYPGIKLLNAANKLAEGTKLPKVRVPEAKDVDAKQPKPKT